MNNQSDMSMKRLQRDQVTPYKLVMLMLVQEYCETMIEDRQQILHDEENVYSEKEERELMFTLLQLLQSADLELKELFDRVGKVSKPKLRNAIQERSKLLFTDGIKKIMDVFQVLPDLFLPRDSKPPLLHKNSIIGLFVRSMVLSFDRQSFRQVTRLYNLYQTFYQAWSQELEDQGDGQWDTDASQLGDASLSIIDIMGNLDDKTKSNGPAGETVISEVGRYSQRQAEYFIAQQSGLLQHNPVEALNPKQLQQKISQLLASNPHLGEAHYLSFLNKMRVQEYCGAVDNLYHYFDRNNGMIGGSVSSPARVRQDDEPSSRTYRYASLSMASLQYRFGHKDEALAAVKEAIALAQEANDHVCLQHALQWLQKLDVEDTDRSAYLLERLVIRAGELNLPYLTSLALQSHGKHRSGTQILPAIIFELLVKSDIINCQNSMADMISVSYAHKAALWQQFGRREMCSLNAQLLLHLNTVQWNVCHSDEPECLALCHLAQLLAGKGYYSLSQLILNNCKTVFPVNTANSKIWILTEQKLAFLQTLNRGDITKAVQAIQNMCVINHAEAEYHQAVILKEKGECRAALDKIHALLKEDNECPSFEEKLSVEFVCRLLLLQGELHCITGNPTDGTAPLLQCLTLAKDHHLTFMVAMATLHLAFVQFCMGLAQQAVTLMEDIALVFLTHGSLEQKAKLLYLWAKCCIAAAANTPAPHRQKVLHTATQQMVQVTKWLRKLEANYRLKDAVYYLARLYDELGYVPERNKCALEFRVLDKQFPTWHRSAVMAL